MHIVLLWSTYKIFKDNFNYIQLLFLTSESKVYINFLYVPYNTLVFERKLLKIQQGKNLGQLLEITAIM